MNQTNNNLSIAFITYASSTDTLTEVGAKLDGLNKQRIEHSLWLDVPQKPMVYFTIAHSRDVIFLKYYVSEKYMSAVYQNINEPVYKDSCVEFFIGFENELTYYNLEFNSAGTVLGGYGNNRTSRRFLNRQVLELIRTEKAMKFNTLDQVFEWELIIAIPAAVFQFHHINNLAEMSCRLNFFKCGDDLPVPHYLAWNAIDSLEPDFHRPEYFGKGLFESAGN